MVHPVLEPSVAPPSPEQAGILLRKLHLSPPQSTVSHHYTDHLPSSTLLTEVQTCV